MREAVRREVRGGLWTPDRRSGRVLCAGQAGTRLGRGAEALGGIVRQRGAQEVRHLLRQGIDPCATRRETIPQEAPEGEHVGPFLLRRRAVHSRRLPHPGAPYGAEVGDLDPLVAAQPDGVRRQVEMADPVVVGRLEGLGNLQRDAHRLVRRNSAAGAQEPAQRRGLYLFEDEPQNVALGDRVVDRHDARVRETRGPQGLALEVLRSRGAAACVQQLDQHGSVEDLVVGGPGVGLRPAGDAFGESVAPLEKDARPRSVGLPAACIAAGSRGHRGQPSSPTM